MSAVEARMGARAAGIGVRIDGDDLVLQASAPPPPAVLDGLSRQKAAIVADHSAAQQAKARASACARGKPPSNSAMAARSSKNTRQSSADHRSPAAAGCWPAWYEGRKAEAVAALAAMEIMPPADLPDDFGKNGDA